MSGNSAIRRAMRRRRKRAEPAPPGSQGPQRTPTSPSKSKTLPLRFATGLLTLSTLAGLETYSFYFHAFSAYCLALFALIQVWRTEEWFTTSRLRQHIATVIIMAAVAWYSFSVVFVSVPMKAAAVLSQAEYPPGSIVGGIKWDPEVSDLRLFLENPTNKNYESVDLIFEFSLPVIVGISYPGSLSGVSLIGDVTKEQIDIGGVIARRPELILDSQGRKVSLPPVQLATSQYRCRIDRLPGKTAAEIVIAIAQVDQSRTSQVSALMPMEDPQGPTGPGVLLGPQAQQVFYKRAHPSQVAVRGTYLASYRKHSIDERIVPVR